MFSVQEMVYWKLACNLVLCSQYLVLIKFRQVILDSGFSYDVKNILMMSEAEQMQYIKPYKHTHCTGCFPLFREDGELEDGEIDDEGIGIEEENKEPTEVNEDKEKEKEKEKAKEKEEKTHRHSRKRYKKTREKRRSKRRRRDRQKVRCYHT